MAGFGLTGISLCNKVRCETADGIIQGTIVSIGSTYDAAEKVIPRLSVEYMADGNLTYIEFCGKDAISKITVIFCDEN